MSSYEIIDEETEQEPLLNKRTPSTSFGATNLSNESEDINEKNSEFIPLDGGYGWIVCLATFWCFGIIIGMDYNYSLIYNKLVVVYNGTENHVVYAAWIGSSAFGLECLFCFPASILIDFFGARKIAIIGGFMSGIGVLTSSFVTYMPLYFLTYSIIFGTGQSLLMGSTFSILPHYFRAKLSFANGMMNFGAAIVTVTLPILTAFALNNLGLVESFYILSAISFSTIFCAFTYKAMIPVDNTQKAISTRIKESFGGELFKKPKFIIWCVSCFIGLYGAMNIVLTIDHHAVVRFPGCSPQILNMAYGASSGIGGLIFGKLGDLTKFSKIYYHTLGYIIFGVTQILIPHAWNFESLAVIIGVFGLADGIYFGFLVSIAYEVAESSKLANQAAGYFQSFVALPVIIGPTVTGLLFEKYQNYTLAYHIGGTICLICSFIQIVSLFFLIAEHEIFYKLELKDSFDFIFRSFFELN